MEPNNIGQSNNINSARNNYTPQPVSADNNSAPQNQETLKFQTEPTHTPINRLNGLDSTLLEKEAYRDIDDDAFKIEYKIEQLESDLKILDKQIASAEALNDTEKVDMLTMKKHSIEYQLNDLYKIYQGADITRKLTGNLTSLMKPKKNVFSEFKQNVSDFINNKILAKISKRFNSGRDLKTALNKLQNINQNVDELVSLQAPYGEKEEKYDRLTRYLTKANTIQYQISKELSKEGSKIKGNPFADQISRERAEAAAKKKDKQDIAKKNALNLNNNLSK